MNETVQNVQIRGMLAKAADECDEARKIATAYAEAWRRERRWNRALYVLIIALAAALVLVM